MNMNINLNLNTNMNMDYIPDMLKLEREQLFIFETSIN